MGSQGTTTVGYPEATTNNPANIPNAQQSTGIFAYQKCYSMASVTDGTSNTVAFAEMIADDQNSNFEMIPGKGTGGTGTLKAVYYYDVNTAGLALVQADIQICNAKYQRDGGGKEGGGYRWSTGAMGYTMFNTVIPPNGGGTIKWGACRNNCCPQTRHADYVNSSSYHPGGVNVALADGSVRFIKNSIAMNIWWALGTRANGEVVSSDSY
jgi:prepilin-type processing-associated H-X9-DG protein